MHGMCPDNQTFGCLRKSYPGYKSDKHAFMWQDDLIGVVKFVKMCVNKLPAWQGQCKDARMYRFHASFKSLQDKDERPYLVDCQHMSF